jgi:hypothetical protein
MFAERFQDNSVEPWGSHVLRVSSGLIGVPVCASKITWGQTAGFGVPIDAFGQPPSGNRRLIKVAQTSSSHYG